MSNEIIDEKKIAEILFNLGIEKSPLICKSKDELESEPTHYQLEMPKYGGLPYFDQRYSIVSNLPAELMEFGYDLSTPDKSTLSEAAGAILFFEMKAGKQLYELTQSILENYPDLGKEGRVVSLFGLSGSGKSLAMEVIRENFLDTIIIDNDMSRYNLLAETVMKAEKTLGRTSQEVKESKVIHNSISGSLYTMLNYVTAELKKRGYTVIRSATSPYEKAEVGLYIEHPDGFDPVDLENGSKQDLDLAAQKLYNRTEARVGTKDNYDWENPETITRFEDMRDVAVQVPVDVHKRFISTAAKKLEADQIGKYHKISNDRKENLNQAKADLLSQLRQYL